MKGCTISCTNVPPPVAMFITSALMLGRIISVRRVRFVAEEFLAVPFITLVIAKQPNIDDELWIALK